MEFEGYHKPISGPGSFEIFHSDDYPDGVAGEILDDGFYWWTCFPGCLPDGDAIGPFDTAEEAHNDANKN